MKLYHGTSMNIWKNFIDKEGVLPSTDSVVVSLTSSANDAISFGKRKDSDFIVLECEINPSDILDTEGTNFFTTQVQRYKIKNWSKNPSLSNQDVEF